MGAMQGIDMEEWRARLAARVAQLKAEGDTQASIAERVGVIQATLSHWINGRREPENLKQWRRLAAAVKMSPSELMFGVAPGKADVGELDRLAESLSDALKALLKRPPSPPT